MPFFKESEYISRQLPEPDHAFKSAQVSSAVFESNADIAEMIYESATILKEQQTSQMQMFGEHGTQQMGDSSFGQTQAGELATKKTNPYRFSRGTSIGRVPQSYDYNNPKK